MRIDNCKTYDFSGDNSVCLFCHNNYELVNDNLTGNTKCEFITTPYCWMTENGAQGVDNSCLFY